jgi:hypothetical protein
MIILIRLSGVRRRDNQRGRFVARRGGSARASRRPDTRVPTFAAVLAEAYMASADEDTGVDDVLEIEVCECQSPSR